MAISDSVRESAGVGEADVSETGDADALKDRAARHSGLRGRLESIRATRTGAATLKIVVGTLGTIMVVGGLIMVPFPGPGWLVVFAGLAVLATEFHWARKLLDFGKRTLHSWTEWLKRQGWTVRILVVAVTFATAGAIIYLALRVSLGIDVVDEARQFLSR